jgi:Arc/MetJ family transcription regulator
MLFGMKGTPRQTRTTLVLDDALIAEATRLTGIQTRRALVHEALRVLIEQKRRLPLSELRGKVKFAVGYDHKAARAGD